MYAYMQMASVIKHGQMRIFRVVSPSMTSLEAAEDKRFKISFVQ
jgi:hypothetical protein